MLRGPGEPLSDSTVSDERRRGAKAPPIIAAVTPLRLGIPYDREVQQTRQRAACHAVTLPRFRASPEARASLTRECAFAEDQAPGGHGP
jgi:hypothetical protein